MVAVIAGSIGAAYCALWFISGLAGRRIPDNLLRMIGKDDERYKVMTGAYAAGVIIGAVAIIAGVRSL